MRCVTRYLLAVRCVTRYLLAVRCVTRYLLTVYCVTRYLLAVRCVTRYLLAVRCVTSRIGQSHTNIHIYTVYRYTVFLAGKSPSVRSYKMYMYGSGQPYSQAIHLAVLCSSLKS
jgi:hypothetical protein